MIDIQWQDHYNVIVEVSNNYMRENVQVLGVTEFKRDFNDLNALVSLHAETLKMFLLFRQRQVQQTHVPQCYKHHS